MMPLGFLKKVAAYVGAKSAEAILPHVSKHPELLSKLVDKMIETGCNNIREKGEFSPKLMDKKIKAVQMVGEMVKLHLPRLAPSVQRKLVFNMWYHQLTHGEPVRDAYKKKYGEWPPTLLVVSPSMRCNLRCEGCYAAEYQKYGELSSKEFINLVDQGKNDFGIHFYTILGGEPTAWPSLWECLEAHPDVFFQVYTHGQLIDDAMAKRAADLGNVAFAISIEGGPNETDLRRGPGTYERIAASMKRLRDAGVLFGFSGTHTTKNHHAIASEAFYQDMLDKGCAFGWIFQYCPIGRKPSMELVPTPEQRIERFKTIDKFRSEHPLVVFDFWNDGEITDGCMAYGRRYMHVLSSGLVEPCVFVHFAQDNIRDKKLIDIVQSGFFKEARGAAPFHSDRRAPCSFIDNPDFLRGLVHKYNLKATHDGAESIVGELHEPLKERSEKYKRLLKELDAEEAKQGTSVK
jgi:MoaA/NifB/PqqE/SkfB family radical SAM enzyme